VNKKIYISIYALSATLLVACASSPTPDSEPDFSARAALAAERQNAIQSDAEPRQSVETPLSLTEELLAVNQPPTVNRIDIEAIERPAAAFFADLGKSQRVNLLLDPSITNNITLSLRGVTLQQTLAALRDSYGYDFERTSYGYRVVPNQISTRVYKLNYLNVERSGESVTNIGNGEENSSNRVTTTTGNVDSTGTPSTSNGFWESLKLSLQGFIRSSSDADNVIINPQTGLLVIRASSFEHNAINSFLTDAELTLQKQVIIEAKIVEVTLDNEFKSGINWSIFDDNLPYAYGDANGSISLDGNNVPGFGDIGGVFNINLGINNFTSMLQLLDYQGDVQVLSSPRVSTINNQKAVIKVGVDDYFATSAADTTTNTDDNTTTTNNAPFNLEKIFSGIALDVTPQISNDDSVTLHVRPSVTEVVERTKVINVGNQSYALPLAYSNIRESDSIIRAKSGQIVVIGGLLQQKQDVGNTGVPFLSKIPFVKYLFQQDRQATRKSELVILLKPTVYDQFTSLNDIDDVLDRIQ
jgi:MSHA biogenesis protein MshL